MIVDLEQAVDCDYFSCDIAIVGAGAVGVTIAVELAAKGKDVLLLEAGGERLEAASQSLFEAAESIGHPLPGLYEGRYRMLGGTTNFWGGQLVRFDPIVFEQRPWLPFSGWPISWNDISPYYERVLQLLRIDCEREDRDVWERLGIETPDFGEGLELFLTRWLPNPILSQLFSKELREGPLRTLVHANVIGIQPAEGPDSLNTLSVTTLTGRKIRVMAKQVVLACGTVEISRLLMMPLASGAKAPWQDLPWLGQGFVDHVDSDSGDVVPIDKKAFDKIFDNIYLDKYKYNPKIKLKSAIQKSEHLLGISAHFLYLSKLTEHLENLKIFARSLMAGRKPANISELPAHIGALWKVAVPLAVRYIKSHRAFNPADGGIKLRLTSEQFPNRTSRIGLTDKVDRLGLPIAAVDWQISGQEIETFVRFGNLLASKFREMRLAEVRLDPRLLAGDPSFMTGVDDGYHQMGGARMGMTPNEGVVDRNLRVHGTNSLYVAGAATFPSTGFANPTFTAMSLGLRLADHLCAKP